MNIGQKINEFDNSLGTVQDFNRIFTYNKLKDEKGNILTNGDVEIGEIKIGSETTRNMVLTLQDMEGNYIIKKFYHDFYPAQGDSGIEHVRHTRETKEKMKKAAFSRKRTPQYKYIVETKDGKNLASFECREKVGNFIGTTGVSVSNYVIGKTEHPKYNIKRLKNK